MPYAAFYSGFGIMIILTCSRGYEATNRSILSISIVLVLGAANEIYVMHIYIYIHVHTHYSLL